MIRELPQAYLFRMKEILREGYGDYLRAMESDAVKGAHINLCKQSAPSDTADSRVFPCPAEPLSWYPEGFLLRSAEHIGQSPHHHAGAFYMQEPSAMAPVCCLSLRPGMKVLDLCSAPGGKASQIANCITNTGILVANEYVPSRARILASNLERMGVRSSMITSCDASVLAEHLPEYFDAVVVDAPCSGEGMFRKDGRAVECWSPKLPASCAERQAMLLDCAAQTLKVGGQLLYCTCTFSPEEDELTVSSFLSRHPEFEPVMPPQNICHITAPGITFPGCICDMSFSRRFYPHISPGEGQYMAVLRKKTSATVSRIPSAPSAHSSRGRGEWDRCRIYDPAASLPDRQTGELAQAFLSDTLDCCGTPKIFMFKDGITLGAVPVPMPLSVIYATGVRLGEVRAGRIVPHHAFFSAYGAYFKRKIEFSRQTPALEAYLRGETFECHCEDGWAVVCADGIPLGGVKVSRGVAKNHYPSGLRKK